MRFQFTPNTVLLVAAALAMAGAGHADAQTQTARVGSKVRNVQVRDSSNEPVWLPYFGRKHLLIFYPDPDHANQNKEFTDHLEDNHIISDNIYCFGIVNLKDAPLMPNSVICSLLRRKEKKNDTEILTDPAHFLRYAWGLGDVNNLFTIIFVTRDGVIEFLHKGKMSQKDIDEFYRVVNKYL